MAVRASTYVVRGTGVVCCLRVVRFGILFRKAFMNAFTQTHTTSKKICSWNKAA